MTSRKEAEDFLLKNRWVESTVPELKNLIEPDRLRERLDTNHRKYADHLERGAWIEHFSGKELIADLVGRIYTKGRPPGDASRQDLAKAVAAQQIASGAVPAELQELKQVLLARLA